MPTQNAGAHSVDAAAQTISGLLNPEPQATPEQVSDVALEPQPAPAAVPAETTPETLAPDTPQSETESPKLYDVKYGDETKQLTVEELISGNMMQRDYSFKTGKLSEREKGIAASEAKLAQHLIDLEAALQNEADNLGSPAMLELKETDPNSYWENFERVKVRADTLNKAKAEQATANQDRLQANIVKERNLMIQAIPEWLDGEKMTTQWQDLSVYLSSRGQDINVISNHEGIVNARKAMLYDRIMSQDIEANKDRTPTKSTTPAPPTAPEVTTAEQDRMATLKKTGRRQDAQAVIKDILSRASPG